MGRGGPGLPQQPFLEEEEDLRGFVLGSHQALFLPTDVGC